MTSIHCPVGGLYPPSEPFQSSAICSFRHCLYLLTDLCVRSVSWDPVSHQSPPWPLLYWRRPSPPTLSCNLITHSLTWDIHSDTQKKTDPHRHMPWRLNSTDVLSTEIWVTVNMGKSDCVLWKLWKGFCLPISMCPFFFEKLLLSKASYILIYRRWAKQGSRLPDGTIKED